MAAIQPPQRTQVLVVGASPVGLLAALRLRQQGAEVRVIEQQSELSTRSFPVVLHPQSLRILMDLGLSAALFWRGRPLNRLAIYTDHERRALLELPKVSGSGAGALTLPQDVIRQALQSALSRLGVAVEYGTRLTTLVQDEHSVWGRLAQHAGVTAGVMTTFDAQYVIGADGYESTARDAIGAQLVEYGALTSFAFFDARTPRTGREAVLALDDESQNSVYPLRDGVSRFSFQLTRSLDRPLDEQLLRELLSRRLPWYSGEVERYSWCGVAEFRRALADRLGRGRIWLAGEAAHLTGPLGVQSLNVGLDEADELARGVAEALRDPRSSGFGRDYEAKRRQQWRELLGVEERAAPSARSPDWVRRHLSRVVACLPASEADLDDLMDQLRLTSSPRQAQRER
jgi:2-polyprenyl-6-methoxyphenol hydroxylase-like FAD-dependent oxidoreductase